MSERTRGIRNWTILIAVMALLAFSGLALAQESESAPDSEATEEGEGPPWLREGFDGDWTPGTPGPPPWAGQDEDNNGKGPPWTREGFDSDWTPGSGPPPWAGQDEDDDGQGPPWTREGFEGDWTPGSGGPPPWAGQEDDDD